MNKANLVTLLLIVGVLVVLGFITYYVYSKPNDALDSEAKKTLSAESGLVFTDLNGNEITFDQFEGKVRVVNTWASWTPFSIKELADLHTVANEYKDKNVVVIAINRKESKEQATAFLQTIQTFENIVFAIDPEDTYFTSVGGYAMPETIVYDEDGNITHHQRGPMTIDQMRTFINTALEATQ